MDTIWRDILIIRMVVEVCVCECEDWRGQEFLEFLVNIVLRFMFVYVRAVDCYKQESCAIAKMTAQCALYIGDLKIFGTP